MRGTHPNTTDAIYLRLNVLDQEAARTSVRARQQIVTMFTDIMDRMETYLDDEFPGWKTNQKLKEMFDRE